MARVFISHSSRDNEQANQIKNWLKTQGFDTPFLDFDKHAGIPPGADWERTLYREIEQCEAIVIIQTPNWLESKWCFAEFTQARALGKPIFPVVEAPDGTTFIAPDIQALDLKIDREGGLKQLAQELTQIALNAQGGYVWDASRAPYPGLMAFQEEDAAIYFGRDDDIRRLIERLNARRVQGGARLIALLGASGSGKSSLMRAGVIPRLKRAGRTWIVTPTLRPQVRPVDELARTLAVALDEPRKWREIRTHLMEDDPAVVLEEMVFDLRAAQGATEGHILLPVDQAEELFSASDPDQSRRFLDLLSAALKANVPILPLFTMRSDHLGDLQAHPALTDRFEEFSLGPLPIARIPQIIEGPARVVGLSLDDNFVSQASRDAETEDALPLLAFALRELYDSGSDDNFLSLEEYQQLGDPNLNLTPLENAVRRRADDVIAELKPDPAMLAALRDAFVPAMVRVNDQGEFVRQMAHWDKLPERAHPVLEKLAEARLLVIRQENEERVVEVAHEALLRKWPLLRGWLDEARDFLSGKRQLEAFLLDWHVAPDEEAKQAALLSGLVLTRAEIWLEERPGQLSEDETALIRQSLEKRAAEAQRLKSLRRQRRNAFAGAFVITLGLLGFAGERWISAKNALNQVDTQRKLAQQQSRIARATAADLDESILETLESLAFDQALGLDDGLLPGIVTTQDPSWVRLLQGRRVNSARSTAASDAKTQFLMARTYRQGRVMAAGHDGILLLCNAFTYQCDKERGTGVQKFFLKLVTSWLAYGAPEDNATWLGSESDDQVDRKIAVGITSGHCEIAVDYLAEQGELLKAQLGQIPGYTVQWVPSPLTPSALEYVDVLIVGNAWGNIAPDEIETVRGFVETGGGLLLAGLGWSWREHLNADFGMAACPDDAMVVGQDTNDMTTYPMNQLLAPFSAQFSTQFFQ